MRGHTPPLLWFRVIVDRGLAFRFFVIAMFALQSLQGVYAEFYVRCLFLCSLSTFSSKLSASTSVLGCALIRVPSPLPAQYLAEELSPSYTTGFTSLLRTAFPVLDSLMLTVRLVAQVYKYISVFGIPCIHNTLYMNHKLSKTAGCIGCILGPPYFDTPTKSCEASVALL